MTGTTWTLDDVDALREGWDFEAKKAAGRDGRGKLPDDFWPTYSAMANSRGGQVVLGLKERRDRTLEVHGIGDPEAVQRELWDLLNNRNKISANLLSEGDVEEVEVEGRTLIVLRIPRAPRSERPVYLGPDPRTGTYLRSHEGDRKADRDRVRRMLADAEYETRDARVLKGYDLADVDADSLAAWRNVFRSKEPGHPWVGLPDLDLLKQLGGWRRDRDEDLEGLTLAGLLMFGRAETITDVLPHYFVDFQERDNPPGGAISWSDRVHPDGRWTGNVFDFFRKVVVKLTADLKVPFRIGPDLQRIDDTPVHRALREALVNALVHADYEGRLSVQVLKLRDGFEFRNPGVPRLPLSTIREGGSSDCRNRNLQKMFGLIGFGERAGSGFSRILQAWREQHWAAPSLDEDPELDTTTLRLTTESLLDERVLSELEARFPDFPQLSTEGRLAIATAEIEGRVTNRRMQEICALHSRDLTFLLKDLVVRGFLVPHGDRAGTWYTVAAEAPLPVEEPQLEFPIAPEGTRQTTRQTTRQSPGAGPTQRGTHLGTQSEAGAQQAVERVASGRYSEAPLVRAAVLAACREQRRTAQEVAELLNRSRKTIQEHYLRPLVKEGRMRRDGRYYRTIEGGQP